MAFAMNQAPPSDLSECDREPIHVPGQIQSFGFLIACRAADGIITHISANAAPIATDPAAALGRSVKEVIGNEVFHDLSNALASSVGPQLPGRAYDLVLADASRCNATVHAHDGLVIYEFEPVSRSVNPAASLSIIRSMLTRVQQADNVDDICRIAVQQVRSLVDFDRVMVYRFLQDGSGSVIAECTVEGVPSFVGHHYPASDIPQQARQLYLKNWLRLIADVHSTPVPVLASSASTVPLDMTYCGLRSVSPTHIQYLKNMGVEASLSISIVVGGALWGLIACHNGAPRVVPADTRLAAEFFGQALSLQLQTLVRADVAEMLREARRKIDGIVSELPPGVPLWESLAPRLADVQAVLPCDGVALWIDGRLASAGSCPPNEEIPRIAAALTAGGHASVFATHELCKLHRPAVSYAACASGMMAVPLSRTPGHYLLLFRREFIRTIAWAGNPEKPIQRDSETLRLSPRNSFELWREEVKNQSRMWEPHDRLTGEALRMALLEIVLKYNEIVVQERAKADRQQKLQNAEFNHRVKNALALVGALVTQSRLQSENIRTFASDLEGRIRALALAHDLASRPGMLELGQLLEIELKPYRNDAGRIDIEGPHVQLAEEASSVLVLIVHEMATNACKHGALSVADGKVRVRWRLDPQGGCALEWRESGGPSVVPPAKTGFGMLLISRQIPFELGGLVDVRFASSGLEIDLWLPPAIISLGSAPKLRGEAARIETEVGVLAGCHVLLVEDNLVVAMDVERRLRRLGAAEVHVLGTPAQALRCAEASRIDVALLDVNLKGATSYAVAEVLSKRGIPFAFSTGYGPDVARPAQFKNVPLVAKPSTDEALSEVLGRVLKRGA